MNLKILLLACSSMTLNLELSQAAPLAYEVSRGTQLPVELQVSLPKGAKTWFYGEVPSVLGNHPILLRFYSRPTTRRAPRTNPDDRFPFNPEDYVLEVWERKIASRRTQFRLLSAAKMSGDKFFKWILSAGANQTTTKVFVSWLRESTKQTPVVRLNITQGSDVNASTGGADILFVFSGGLKINPHVQQLDNYAEMDSSQRHSYGQVDEQGVLIVNRENGFYSSVADPVIIKSQLYWNGSAFVDGSTTPSQSK